MDTCSQCQRRLSAVFQLADPNGRCGICQLENAIAISMAFVEQSLEIVERADMEK